MVKRLRNSAQSLFKDSDGLLPMLLLSQAADSSRPCPRKTKAAGWRRSARTRPFARYNRKNAFHTIRHVHHPLDMV